VNFLAQVVPEVRWPNGEVKRSEAGSFALNQYLTIDYSAGSCRRRSSETNSCDERQHARAYAKMAP